MCHKIIIRLKRIWFIKIFIKSSNYYFLLSEVRFLGDDSWKIQTFIVTYNSSSPASFPRFTFLGVASLLQTRPCWTYPVIVYHITLIHMVITRLNRYAGSTKTFRTMRGTMPEGEVCVGGGDRGTHRGDCGGYRCGHWRRRKRGKVWRCECDIEFAPWRRACYRQCPTAGPEAICSLCDEIYESFQRSRGRQLRKRKRERAPVGRARTAERALGVYSYGYRRREHVPLVLHWSYGEGRSFA